MQGYPKEVEQEIGHLVAQIVQLLCDSIKPDRKELSESIQHVLIDQVKHPIDFKHFTIGDKAALGEKANHEYKRITKEKNRKIRIAVANYVSLSVSIAAILIALLRP